jgi:hypothetical protein
LRRVNAYIDGYNFYVPLSAEDHPERLKLAWSNYFKLAVRLAARTWPDGKVQAVKYFTATIPPDLHPNQAGLERKKWWLDAQHLDSGGKVEIIHGIFRPDDKHPTEHREKKTDTNMAIAVVRDAALGHFKKAEFWHGQEWGKHYHNTRDTPAPCDAVLLISADQDALPAAEMAQREFGCAAWIAFPAFQHGYPRPVDSPVQIVQIQPEDLTACLLPERIQRADGGWILWEEYKQSRRTKTSPRLVKDAGR